MSQLAVIYGTDVAALLDLSDPEVIVSEDLCAAYACCRRLLTPDGALEDIGETEQYDSIDVTEWLGASIDLTDPTVINDLESQATQVLYSEPYAQGGVTVTATFTTPVGASSGSLALTIYITGAPGPFTLVVQNGVDGVTAQLLMPGQT